MSSNKTSDEEISIGMLVLGCGAGLTNVYIILDRTSKDWVNAYAVLSDLTELKRDACGVKSYNISMMRYSHKAKAIIIP